MSESVSQEWFKIGQVARRLNISVELIRAYEKEGLLITEKTESGQRVFNEDDIYWLQCIRRLITEQGLNFEGIRRLLALMPCWECGPCTEDEKVTCPAYIGTTKPCWMIKDQLPETCRSTVCRECKVYRNASKCENLKRALFQPRIFFENK